MPSLRSISALAGLLVAVLIVLLPGQFEALTSPWAWWRPPFEPGVALALLVLVPARGRRMLAWGLALLFTLMLVMKLADMAALGAYWRTFDPVSDWRLLGPGWNVLSNTVGVGWARAGLLLLLVLLILVLVVLGRGFEAAARGGAGWPRRALAASLGCSALVLVIGGLGGNGWAATTTASIVAHVRESRSNLEGLAELKARVAQADPDDQPGARLFTGLRGRDVLLLFVESYGRSALDDPRYQARVRGRLEVIEHSLGRVNYEARSGWLESPTVGGQSWLAHSTLLSGLWINSQRRYNWLTGTSRLTLTQLFGRAGWRTVAAMPANTRAWPEADFYGYDMVYDARSLGYEGRPFNWVTMPDQFTLASVYQRELAARDDVPVMLEAALISSHAPWTPIPTLRNWDQLDRGRVFNDEAVAGDPPAVVWQDPERVRAQYLESIDYTLQVIGSFVTAYQQTDPVVIVLGDHQPASIITGDRATRQVPMHILAPRGNALLDEATEWGWTSGMIPAAGQRPVGMDQFRHMLVTGRER
ncbi:sulfatase-like hydrolase/transferase [Larsenimonas rhizosphaerae]|uniref:Sulfatase N-terminal domain-containing protein n=1 Tax=Larsenimonas rhizosphaerae TaxID=2944682 RepID=A0AA41ZQ45_9GAMM|nr:sulfatase-like hydrolase/transferase [Larsenimonas rhizosphaerae]MCX2525225.1 hypothetical protein [Larsenimonas rhizosphaerae]